MPNLNRKGPNGEGAMTGRKMGKYSPENKGKTDEEILQDKTMSSQPGKGMGCGQGRGLGLGRGKGKGQGLGQGFRKNG
jgi:hypothetical protein